MIWLVIFLIGFINISLLAGEGPSGDIRVEAPKIEVVAINIPGAVPPSLTPRGDSSKAKKKSRAPFSPRRAARFGNTLRVEDDSTKAQSEEIKEQRLRNALYLSSSSSRNYQSVPARSSSSPRRSMPRFHDGSYGVSSSSAPRIGSPHNNPHYIASGQSSSAHNVPGRTDTGLRITTGDQSGDHTPPSSPESPPTSPSLPTSPTELGMSSSPLSPTEVGTPPSPSTPVESPTEAVALSSLTNDSSSSSSGSGALISGSSSDFAAQSEHSSRKKFPTLKSYEVQVPTQASLEGVATISQEHDYAVPHSSRIDAKMLHEFSKRPLDKTSATNPKHQIRYSISIAQRKDAPQNTVTTQSGCCSGRMKYCFGALGCVALAGIAGISTFAYYRGI